MGTRSNAVIARQVFIFDHFRCDGPFELAPGRSRRVLAVDYGVSCESGAYRRAYVYMSLALAIYVFGVPLALLLRLWANRRGEAATPSQLAARDGPLAGLATKYSGQFYWVEFVDIFERLLLCGLTVFAREAASRGRDDVREMLRGNTL